MANFKPFRDYILHRLAIIIDKYKPKSPFLDVGGGSGYTTEFLLKKQLTGKYIDVSEDACKVAADRLKEFDVELENKSVFEETGRYNTIVCFDVLEHIEDDSGFVRQLTGLCENGGYLVFTVPINQREYRWDDSYYGHLRRYNPDKLIELFQQHGLYVEQAREIAFPIFWCLRRLYMRFFPAKEGDGEKLELTKQSSCQNAWCSLLCHDLLVSKALWWPVFMIQDRISNLKRGNEAMIVLRYDKPAAQQGT
jgi:SAM-dependent methyltransferase